VWQRSFENQGFAIFPPGLNQSEINRLLAELSCLVPPAGKAGIRHVLQLPSVSSVAHDSRFLGIAKDVLGEKAFPFRATFFDKSPERNWLIAWHQDTALPLRERRDVTGWGPWSRKDGVTYAHAPAEALRQIVALRIHCDESNLQNGPLRVLPGTHAMGVLSDDEIHRISTEIVEVRCSVSRGGVLAMRPLLIHSSSKSESKLARRVLHIEYASGPTIAGEMQLAVA